MVCLAPQLLLPSCYSQFICTQMGDHPLCQQPPRPVHQPRLATSPLHPSLPLLPVWMIVSSLTSWLLDFHTVQFSGSSGWVFLFLNLLLSFFWLWEEAQCVYLHFRLGRRSQVNIFLI